MKHQIKEIKGRDGRVIKLPFAIQVEDGEDGMDVLVNILDAVLKHYQTQNCDNRRPK